MFSPEEVEAAREVFNRCGYSPILAEVVAAAVLREAESERESVRTVLEMFAAEWNGMPAKNNRWDAISPSFLKKASADLDAGCSTKRQREIGESYRWLVWWMLLYEDRSRRLAGELNKRIGASP